MKLKINKNIIILFIFIVLGLSIYILYYNIEEFENFTESLQKRNLKKDGFCVLYNPEYSLKTSHYACPKLQDDILHLLPNDYIFIDYIYKINNVALSTFHRDVTSSQKIFNTKYPVYTLILYKYDGELLSLCPGSNKTYPFVWSRIVNINGNSGTAFLFDCDVLHAGRLNNCNERKVIQYKICHKDDLNKLESLVGVNNEKTDKCINSLFGQLVRKMSYFFEMPINYFAYPFMIKRENDNSFIGFIQSFLPMGFYNNI